MANLLPSTDAEDLKVDFTRTFFSQKYTITDIRSDVALWNRDWEEILRKLSAQEAFSTLKVIWEPRDDDDAERMGFLPSIEKHVLKVQNLITDSWKSFNDEDHFETAWLLLPEKDRKRFLLKAIEGALRSTSLSHDARALCPEISTKSMLKENGKAWITFIKDFVKYAVDGTQIYHLPSEWWNEAAHEPANEPEPGYVYACLTVQRAEFIGTFVPRCAVFFGANSLHLKGRFIIMSMLEVVAILAAPKGSSQSHPAVELMQTAGTTYANAMTETLSTMNAKPIIRCEHCEKSPEEVGDGPRFAMCSKCKANLDFVVHYCSS